MQPVSRVSVNKLVMVNVIRIADPFQFLKLFSLSTLWADGVAERTNCEHRATYYRAGVLTFWCTGDVVGVASI